MTVSRTILGIACAITTAFSAGALKAAPLPASGRDVIAASISASQSTIPDIWSCTAQMQAAYDASGLPKGSDLRTIRQIDRIVRSKFRYKPEPVEKWSNHASAIIGGQRVTGDCEDHAITAVTLAICAGVPEEKLGLVFSKGGSGPAKINQINHVFGFFNDGGKVYALGDTMRSAMSRVSVKRDKVILWQTISQLQADPARLHSSIVLPVTGQTASGS